MAIMEPMAARLVKAWKKAWGPMVA